MSINKTDFPVLEIWMLRTINLKCYLHFIISVYVTLSFLNKPTDKIPL